MTQGLTNIDKRLGRIIYLYCVIFAAVCMIFAFSSCSNMRSVKSKSYQGISKSGKNKNYEKVDTISGNISEFEEKILNNKNSNTSKAVIEDDDEGLSLSTQSAVDITSKRLPTLREQMNNLAQDQESIKTQVNTLQGDVNEIKNSIDDIKDAITVLKFSPDNTPQKGVEPEEQEPEFDQAVEEEAQEDYSIVQPDEKVTKKPTATKPVVKNTPKKTNKPVTKKAKPANTDLNHNQAKPVAKPENTKKAEPNNLKATTKVEVPAPKNLNDNVKSALDYFAKKDYHKAINELNTIMTKSNDSETLSNCNYWMGESYFRLANYSEAIKFFNKTAADNSSPKNAEARIMVGESLIRMGKVEDAKNAFETFLANHPKSQYAPRAKKMLQQL